MAISIVITHPEQGIYLGNFIGLGFWSMLYAGGTTMAATFPSEEDARDHVAGWKTDNNPDAYTYALVDSIFEQGATIPELQTAGLGHLLGGMTATVEDVGSG